MDYQKINNRWIFGLTLSVFGRNLTTYATISFLVAVLSIGQAIMPFIGLITIPITIYLSCVSFLVAHRTILNDEVISVGEAFEMTPRSKTYFWQYLFVTAIPAVIFILGMIALVSSENENLDYERLGWLIFGGAAGSYYILMAFFGTSLTATAVEGDGMMMASRGRVTFLYSLSRLIFLPALALAALVALVYYILTLRGPWQIEDIVALASGSASETVFAIFAIYTGIQLVTLLLNLITAVVITKAFLLAEVRLALQGNATEWGKRRFGIAEQANNYVYK